MSRSVRFALIGTLLTTLALLVPVPALHVVAAPLLVYVWPSVACACWLRKRLEWRDARSWAVGLIGGLALAPLIVFLSALLIPFSRTSTVLLLGGAIALVLSAAPRSPIPQPPPIYFTKPSLLLIGFTLLMILGALFPVRNEYRSTLLPLYVGAGFSDWYKHYGLTWEIEATGIPPHNLMFLSEPPQVQVYHIFFHLSTAMLDLLSDRLLGINFWLSANTLLATAALLVALYALARILWVRERTACASLLYVSVLGGLDIIPSLANFLQGRTGGTPYFHTEIWAGCLSMTDTFFTAFTWVPQHAMALAILLLAWTIYLSYPAMLRVTLLIALLGVSATGFSVFVPVGALLGVGLLAGFNLYRSLRAGRLANAVERARPWLVAGLVAAVVALPLALYETSSVAASGGAAVDLWLRAFDPPHDPAHGAIFQWLFPAGGIIAQGLDLPFYYLFEMGATLPAALIGLVIWSRSGPRRAWLPGVFAAAATLILITFVKSNLGCNDLGMRGSYPLQAMLALWAGGGWAALWSKQIRGNVEAPTGKRSSTGRAALFVAILALAVAILAYQWPWTYRYDLTNTDDVSASSMGLYARESANNVVYRWTRDRVTLSFDGLAQNVPYEMIVRAAAGSRPAGAPAALAAVWVNDRQIGEFTANEFPADFTIEVPPSALDGRTTTRLELRISAYRPDRYGLGDRRTLGLLLDSVTLRPLRHFGQTTEAGAQGTAPAAAVPPWDVMLATLVAAYCAASLSQRRLWQATLPAFIALGLLLARPSMVLALPALALLFGALWVGRRVVPPITAWLARRLAQGRTLLLRVLIVPFALVGLATTIWQVATYDVSKLLPAYDQLTGVDDTHSLALENALRFIRTELPANIVFQVDPTVENFAERVSVTAERPHYYTHDQVFNYQFPEAYRDERLRQVRLAFDAPNANEACSRFRALGINVLLVELPHYPWLGAKDATGGCFVSRYQKSVWAVLEVK